MTLRDLMGNGAPEIEVSGLAYSSRSVTQGALFFCVPGFRADGHDFAPDAVARGAAALVCERPLGLGVPEVLVDDVRAAMGPVAARFYGDPTAELQLVGVTGTNGKTTTAELLGAIWRAAELPVAVAGNVGTPLSSLVGEIGEEVTVVCEVSSFQAEDSELFTPDTALLLNIEEDHLDRHGTLEAYREAKLRLFRNQTAEQVAVAPAGFELPGEGRRIVFGDPAELPLPPDEIRLRGPHNLENAMGASAAALASDVPGGAVAAALRGFTGVPHRLEEVGTVGGVLYVNDSKATNVSSALRGIEAFEGGVHAILGGSLKGGGFEGLRRAVASRCRACYLIGEAAERLQSDLAGAAPLRHCGDLESAMHAASSAASPGEIVLLSPACASYDQFRDYEERGERFRALIPRA
jgi:UDP-N-acetylmuramoylalanine--D-glutamate ligase